MRRSFIAAGVLLACGAGFAALVRAQGRGGGEWTTSGFDAQRTAWVRTDARLTKEAVQSGNFQFLWKLKFHNDVRQLNSLTEPILLDRLIGYRGFKSLAFIGGSDDRVFAIDTDLARPYWTTHFSYWATTGGAPPSSWACPGGLIAAPSRRSTLAPAPAFGGGGGGRGGRSASAVGEPGRGAAVLSQPPQARGGAPAGLPQGARGAAPGNAPTPGAGRAAAGAIPFGGVDPIYAVGSDGFLHTLASSNGADAEPPVPFLPPSVKPSALIYVDGVVYASTSNGCGAVPNAVWAIDLTASARKVASWKTNGPSVAGSTGPAFGSDGTLYVALDRGPSDDPQTSATDARAAANYSSAVVALDRTSLQPRDWISIPDADFRSSPVVFRYKDKEMIAAAGNNGRMYLLDTASLGGADHKTPLYVTPKYSAPGAGASLATWDDRGTRWILAPSIGPAPAGVAFTSNGLRPNGSVVAFKVADQGGTLTLEPAWSSRDLTSPLAPIVVNGVIFVASSGEYRGSQPLTATERAQRSTPAVLYALDGATGKTLWNSGRTITSFARGGLSAGGGQMYLVTFDNHVYAFGIPMEH